jgi:hypothetical protein
MIDEQSTREEIRYNWQMPDGTSCRITLFDITVSEAESVAKAYGWPGRAPLQA